MVVIFEPTKIGQTYWSRKFGCKLSFRVWLFKSLLAWYRIIS